VVPELTLDQPQMWAIASLTAVVAGFVRGFAGFGGPAIMALVLVQFYAPVSVLAKVILIDVLSGLKLLPSTAHEVDRRLTAVIVASSLLGAPIGVYALLELDPVVTRRAIAAVSALSTLAMLAGWRFKKVPPLWVHAVVGFLSGVIIGATYIALVMIVFLFATPARATVSRANTVYWAFILSISLIGAYAATGVLDWDGTWRSLLLGLLYLAAVVAGTRVFRVTRERDFRRYVLWLLLALSAMAMVGN
jgi:uncharacterized membrane protein YfcA